MYKRPLWLFWGGPSDVPLEALYTMYLLRFGVEHFFRFAKRRMGLLIAQTSDLVAAQNWVWIVTLAYIQLLLARHLVTAQPRPWDPKPRRDPAAALDAWTSAPGVAGIFARVGYTGSLAQTCWKIARTRGRIPSQASATLPGGHQEAKTAVCGLKIGIGL